MLACPHPHWFMKALLLSVAVLSGHAVAQAPGVGAGSELIDVASFFNGGYPYTPAQKKQENASHIASQLRAISHSRTVSPFMRDDLKEKIGEGDRKVTLFYAFAAPATIESFRVSGESSYKWETPARVEFALSQSPDGEFQTVAALDVPESYLAAPRTQYDFSVSLKQKASGRYVRISLFRSKYGNYRLSRFSAYGRFDRPVELRTDFSGVYHIFGSGNPKQDSPANRAMTTSQEGTGYSAYLILHQKGGQINGCYAYGLKNGRSGSEARLQEISEVLGDVTGGVENNVFRFTRTYAKDGSQSQGAMVFAPVGQGIFRDAAYSYIGYFLVMKDADLAAREGDGAFRVHLTRYFSNPPPCAIAGQKEKTASEAMQESLEKTGKVQLYGVNFDFDSDALRPESGAVLDEVVTLAKANPGWKFEIGGHTDSVGSADYNLKLSDRRAASVVRYLTGKGVDAARLKAKGYGATRPLIADASNDAAHAQNRRVELVKQ